MTMNFAIYVLVRKCKFLNVKMTVFAKLNYQPLRCHGYSSNKVCESFLIFLLVA